LINHEITYDAVKKSSGVRGWVQVVKAQPHSFRLSENLNKILESPGKNGAQRCLTLKQAAHGLQKNT